MNFTNSDFNWRIAYVFHTVAMAFIATTIARIINIVCILRIPRLLFNIWRKQTFQGALMALDVTGVK